MGLFSSWGGSSSATDENAVASNTNPIPAIRSPDSAQTNVTRAPDSRKKRLRKFDTTAFTLHEHCGVFSSELKECMKSSGAGDDPVALQKLNFDAAPSCKNLWDEYRLCGRRFFDSVTAAQQKCAKEAEALRNCKGHECEVAEAALIKCSATRVRQTMSGTIPKDMLPEKQ